jgi:O-antigen ligase
VNTRYMPPTQPKTRPQMTGLSVTALVLGSVALALSPVPILNNAGAICGILAIIMGLVATIRARRWMPVFGIALGASGLVVTLALQAQWARELDDIQNDLDQFQTELNEGIEDSLCDPTLPGTPPAGC